MLAGIPVLGQVIGLADTWLEGRNVRTKASAKADAAVRIHAAKNAGEWERLQVRSSDKSWKDEAWTVCFIGIIAAAFIPSCQPHVAQGMEFLEKTPEWFRYAVGLSIAASFANKGMDKWLTKRR